MARHPRDELAEVVPVQLPRRRHAPLRIFAVRVCWGLGLILFVAALAFLGRTGYVDAKGDDVSLLDCFYYATVTVTTTGYGDVRPESDGARLVTTLLVTPARMLFLILLVGTTVEILAERTRHAFDLRRWRSRMKDHTIICGFGTKGRMAVESLRSRGTDLRDIVVIDPSDAAATAAAAIGLALVRGDATRVAVLHEAGIESAKAVVVGPDRDDAAVLITLTARELNPKATIVAAVREEQNVHLLRQSGADSVITSSGAAGRLLGLATRQPAVVAVLEDLLSSGSGLDVVERAVGAGGVLEHHEPVVAIVRDGRVHRYDDPAVAALREGDRALVLCSHPDR